MAGHGIWTFAVALGFASAALAAPARAEPGAAARLVYGRTRGLEQCPDQTALRAAVSRRLGYDPFVAAARQTVVVDIASEGDTLVGRVRLLAADGVVQGARELRAEPSECAELAASLALAISLTLDPTAAFDSSGQEGPEAADVADAGKKTESIEPAAEPVPSQPQALQVAIAPAAPERDAVSSEPRGGSGSARLEAALRGGALTGVGVAPAPNVGLWAGLGLQYRRVRFNFELRLDHAASIDVSPDGSVESALSAAALSGCLAHGWAHFCASAALGVRSVKGFDVPEARSDTAFYAALGARFEARATVAPDFGLLANVEALGVVTPLTLRVAGTDVWSSPPVALTLNLGAEYSL